MMVSSADGNRAPTVKNATRARAYLLLGLFALATAFPAFLPASQDGYPLSTYPMFSRDRGRQAVVAAAVAGGRGGREQAIPPRLIANAEAMQAVRTLNKALQHGHTARQLCRDIAERIAHEGGPALRHTREVRLLHKTIDSVAFLAGDTSAERQRVRARCPIPGRAP